MDNYRAIYDVVRSRMDHIYFSELIDRIAQSWDASSQVAAMLDRVEYELTRPSVLKCPTVSTDGNQWIALYGKDLKEGVAGYGDSPAKAMMDFDANWRQYFT